MRAIGSGVLWPHIGVTLLEIVLGFAVGAPLAILVGIALAKSLFVERALSPYIVAAQAIPILALAPLLDIWFGGGLSARVVVCALIVFFPITIATMVGIRSTDPLLDEMLRSLGATPAQRTRLLEIPSALPVIFGGLRVGRDPGGHRRGRRGVGLRRRRPASASSSTSPTRGSSTPRSCSSPSPCWRSSASSSTAGS